MGEQHNKKGDDWLDESESYRYRVKSMASSNARLLPQVCSLKYETQNLQTSLHQDLTHPSPRKRVSDKSPSRTSMTQPRPPPPCSWVGRSSTRQPRRSSGWQT